jgi:hypothetical protein
MRRRSRARGKTIAIGGAVAAVLAAVAARVARRRGTKTTGRTEEGASPQPSAEERYTCACGAEYRTTGAGRHRVFWVLDAPADDPVLEDHCPACGKAWPAEETSHITAVS